MVLTTQQQILVEQKVTNEKKSSGTAYLLWFFFGWLGGHRFYLGYPGSGAAMVGLWVLGLLTLGIGVGLLLFGALGIWVLVDLFLIPGLVKTHMDDVRRKISHDITMMSGTVATPN
jgi:TM2 domain-containing membrane protein YozV